MRHEQTVAKRAKLLTWTCCILALLAFSLAGTTKLAAQSFPITFNATALDSSDFSIDFGAIGGVLPNAVTTLQIMPGTHTFTGPASTAPFNFEVTAAGIVDYDASLDAFVSGRGTSTLPPLGFSTTIDATALDAQTFSIDFGSSGGVLPNAVTTGG